MVDLLLQPPPQLANQPSIDDRRSVAQRRLVEERRLALVVEYQGTNYHGFQLQDDQPTIQGQLEQALHRLTGQSVRIRGASRTDSGAHAKAQVVDFLTPALLSKDVFMRGLNFYLPPDIKVRASYDIDLDFHSRNSASSRTYRYTLLNNPAPSPLMREFSHWVRDSLDVPIMNEAATALHGVHDFAPLAGALPPSRSAVREVKRWELWREGDLVLMEATANGFLPHQIRRAGAVLLAVGLGRLAPRVLQDILACDTTIPAWCAALPAKGLCLISVDYNDFPPESKGT